MLPPDIAPHWGFSPRAVPPPPPKRRRRNPPATSSPRRNVAVWRAVLRLASVRGEVRSAEVAGSLGISARLAAARLVRIADAGYLAPAYLERVYRPQGGGKTWVYRLTAQGRRWLAAQDRLASAGPIPALSSSGAAEDAGGAECP
jgi:hypothetical protein